MFPRQRIKVTIKSIKDADPAVLKKVMASTLLYMKNIDTNSVFHKSDVLFNLNKYTEYIQRPLSFFEVEQLLNEGKYLTLESFLADMKLIFDNCINYHTSEYSKYDAKVKRNVVAKARKMHQHLRKQYSKLLKKKALLFRNKKFSTLLTRPSLVLLRIMVHRVRLSLLSASRRIKELRNASIS